MNRIKHCWICCGEFEPRTAWQRYCSRRCQSENWRNSKGRIIDNGRYCRQCGRKFILKRNEQNKQHCSTECSTKSARESRSKFYRNNPDKMQEYRKKYLRKVGGDSVLSRFYIRYPSAPRECQSCGEDRVLELAHKPEHRRNGAWRNNKNTTIDKIYILCPTCHRLLDKKVMTEEQLGLKKNPT